MTFIIIVCLAAFMGGVLTALIGWGGTTEPFNARKFMTSVVKSLIGAVVIAAAFDYSQTTSPISYLLAFLSGAGVDAGLKRVTNAITNTPVPATIPETITLTIPPTPPPLKIVVAPPDTIIGSTNITLGSSTK